MAKMEDTLRNLAAEHEGLFTAREAEQAGIARVLVVQLAHRGRLRTGRPGLVPVHELADDIPPTVP